MTSKALREDTGRLTVHLLSNRRLTPDTVAQITALGASAQAYIGNKLPSREAYNIVWGKGPCSRKMEPILTDAIERALDRADVAAKAEARYRKKGLRHKVGDMCVERDPSGRLTGDTAQRIRRMGLQAEHRLKQALPLSLARAQAVLGGTAACSNKVLDHLLSQLEKESGSMTKQKKTTGAAGRLGIEKPADPKPVPDVPRKTAAWKIPVTTLANLKAYAVMTNQEQFPIVAAALDEHLDRVIAESGDAEAIEALAAKLS